MKDWKNLKEDTIETVDDLISCKIPIENKNVMNQIVHRHPMKIPSYYFKLIDFENCYDPIRKMSVPTEFELDDHGEYDTSGEESNTVIPGLQHKYKQTALILSTNQCYMYCRHCFRKRMVGYTENEIMSTMLDALSYIQEHKEISNVLVSGGDSFALQNNIIKEYLDHLTQIDHLNFIRFGTRTPVVLPMRISQDKELLDILSTYNKRKPIIVVTQFNHPNEINQASVQAIQALKEIQIDVYNQTVLLKDINDDAGILSSLFQSLQSIGIIPYYLFQCRPVKYVKNHFQVPFFRGIDIVHKTRDQLDGISKQFRFAMSHPKGKIEILGNFENKTLFKFHQAKEEKDAHILFTRETNHTHTWLDSELDPM